MWDRSGIERAWAEPMEVVMLRLDKSCMCRSSGSSSVERQKTLNWIADIVRGFSGSRNGTDHTTVLATATYLCII